MDLVISEQELKAIRLKPYEVRLEFALWLYQTGKWNSAKARQFLGLDTLEWRQKLSDRKIEYQTKPENSHEDTEFSKAKPFIKNVKTNSALDYNQYFGVSQINKEQIERYLKQARAEWNELVPN